jgi:hypothetical protein
VFLEPLLNANLNLTTVFPWSTEPLSNWMTWLVSVLLFHVLTLNVQAYLNRSAKNHISDSMNEEFIPPRFKIARELSQEDDKQLGAAWATTLSMFSTVRYKVTGEAPIVLALREPRCTWCRFLGARTRHRGVRERTESKSPPYLHEWNTSSRITTTSSHC